MLKFLEDGLFATNCSTGSAFKLMNYTANNANNGITMARRVMVISVAGQPVADETFSLGAITYTFKDSGATGYQINLGADHETTTTNIIAQINLDRVAIGCSAYALGKDTYILLIENVAGDAPLFTALGTKIIQNKAWSYTITEAVLEDTDYFKVDNTVEETAIPVVLTEQNAGTKDNFLY